ncbi:hypothetical protein P5673_017351 [Acropora cervicornis]|uniref:Uncharacterized protein n=1 Tax=Acropora cervicornis TaxID=6130 RepID=A0AAD9V3I4_ACRCE|nr:hypothetical protein P5673_017351 [Acropora cervicornis]
MSFLPYNDKRDGRSIVLLKFHTSFLHSAHFVNKNLIKLPLADTITVKQDLRRLTGPIRFDKLDEEFFYNLCEVSDDHPRTSAVLVLLHADACVIFRGMIIHTCHHRSNGGNAIFCWGEVAHMGTKHDSRFIERWFNRIVKDVIGSSKFGIDITRDVSRHLRFGLLHMFHLNALCRNADHAIANAFHFGVEFSIENWKDNHDELKSSSKDSAHPVFHTQTLLQVDFRKIPLQTLQQFNEQQNRVRELLREALFDADGQNKKIKFQDRLEASSSSTTTGESVHTSLPVQTPPSVGTEVTFTPSFYVGDSSAPLVTSPNSSTATFVTPSQSDINGDSSSVQSIKCAK